MADEKKLVLDSVRVQQTLQRMAHQIVEEFFHEPSIILVGIESRGSKVAELIHKYILEIKEAPASSLFHLTIDNENLFDGDYKLTTSLDNLNGKSVILIDDVLNSGKTLMYATRYLLGAEINRMSTAVLVDRRHRSYPIRADMAGLTLSTTLQNHISVEFHNGETSVYIQ